MYNLDLFKFRFEISTTTDMLAMGVVTTTIDVADIYSQTMLVYIDWGKPGRVKILMNLFQGLE